MGEGIRQQEIKSLVAHDPQDRHSRREIEEHHIVVGFCGVRIVHLTIFKKLAILETLSVVKASAVCIAFLFISCAILETGILIPSMGLKEK